jgi:hypothetical protein
MGGLAELGGLKSKSANYFKICPSPKKTCLVLLGGAGSPKAKTREECFRLSGKNKGRQVKSADTPAEQTHWICEDGVCFIKPACNSKITFACQVYITMLCKQEASPKKSRPLFFQIKNNLG